MKKMLVILGVVVVGAGLFALGYLTRPIALQLAIPKVLVEVNGVKITDLDLKQEMSFLQVGENTPFSSITREDVLDRMINDVLILNESARYQVAITEADINTYLEKFWQGYTTAEAEAAIKEHGLSQARWNDLVERRLRVEATIKHAIENQILVGEDEAEEYYWSHLMEYYKQAQVSARQIVVDTLAQAQTLRKQLDAGEDFQALARKYSRGPEKDQGGDLGWVGLEDLPKSFTRVLFQLQPGEISQPVATEYGFHIFLVEKREKGGRIPLDEARPMIAEKLKLEKSDRAFQSWLENLRAQAKIVMKNREGEEQ